MRKDEHKKKTREERAGTVNCRSSANSVVLSVIMEFGMETDILPFVHGD